MYGRVIIVGLLVVVCVSVSVSVFTTFLAHCFFSGGILSDKVTTIV